MVSTYTRVGEIKGRSNAARLLRLLPKGRPVRLDMFIEKNRGELIRICGTEEKALSKLNVELRRASRRGILKGGVDFIWTESFAKLPTVGLWSAQQKGTSVKNATARTSGTRGTYMRLLWGFNKWLSGKKFTISGLKAGKNGEIRQYKRQRGFQNVEELLMLLSEPFSDDQRASQIIVQYLAEISPGLRPSTITVHKSAILSYFAHNGRILTIQFKAKADRADERHSQKMTLSDFHKIVSIGSTSPLQRAVFMCKFHRGLDSSTLADKFNFEAWDQLVEYFGSEDYPSWDVEKCPVPIVLVRIKTDYRHRGFLERDAVAALQDYLKERERQTGAKMQKGQALFINTWGRPIKSEWISRCFADMIKRAGLRNCKIVNGRNRYDADSHETRDLLKSALRSCGAKEYAAEHVIGHMPRDSYDKAAEIFPDELRDEYAKGSRKLNVFSRFESVSSGSDDPDALKVELRATQERLQKLETSDDHVMREKYEDMFNVFAARLARLEDGMPGAKDELKYRCSGCKLVHNQNLCPSCGSQYRRVYQVEHSGARQEIPLG